MLKNNLLLALVSCFFVITLSAQSVTVGYAPPVKHASELGLHVGYAASYGDVDNKPGFGVGIHFRKAIDYLWSVRVDGKFLSLNGEDDRNTIEYKTSVAALSAQGIITLNNLKYDGPKKTNIYAFFGGGVGSFSPDVTSSVAADPDSYTKATLEAGLGFAFKINEKIQYRYRNDGYSTLRKRPRLGRWYRWK